MAGAFVPHGISGLGLAPDKAFSDDLISRSADFRVIEVSIVNGCQEALFSGCEGAVSESWL